MYSKADLATPSNNNSAFFDGNFSAIAKNTTAHLTHEDSAVKMQRLV
jgi:hypothetical protein